MLEMLLVSSDVRTETLHLGKESTREEDSNSYKPCRKLNTTVAVIESRPRLVMSNGSRCKATSNGSPGDVRGSSVVEFICDASAGTGAPRLVAELPPGDDEIGCAYVFEWRTKVRCQAPFQNFISASG